MLRMVSPMQSYVPTRTLSNLTRLIRDHHTVFPGNRGGKLFRIVRANISFASLLRHQDPTIYLPTLQSQVSESPGSYHFYACMKVLGLRSSRILQFLRLHGSPRSQRVQDLPSLCLHGSPRSQRAEDPGIPTPAWKSQVSESPGSCLSYACMEVLGLRESRILPFLCLHGSLRSQIAQDPAIPTPAWKSQVSDSPGSCYSYASI